MGIKSADAEVLKTAILAAAKELEAKKEWINELNVFPVPDGDTGTNMTMTIMAAAKEVAAITEPTLSSIAKALSSGSLRGARGNSGVILSQLFRGFGKEIGEAEKITVPVLAGSFTRATETAYKAVMKPKEGTILTVARGMADKAAELAAQTEDVAEFLEKVIEHGDFVLSQTPEMLPVLKQAGVVDSGGQGLMQVIKGALDVFKGKEIEYTVEKKSTGVSVSQAQIEEKEIKFGYCTEFIILLEKPMSEETEHDFKEFLMSIGDSIVLVADEDIVKVHVHTNDPGKAISRALTYGALSRMKIDNMREEHHEKLIKDAEKLAAQQAEEEKKKEPKKECGFISVSIGEGIGEIFKGLGVDCLIEGGQTMNPSTEDMLSAIDKVNADHVFIFPNNKNVILAANQAKALTKDKKIFVIPTKTVPQGITAVINYNPERTPEENEAAMLEEIQHVKTGEVTYAVRDTHIDDKEIHEGDYMGIGDHSILSVGKKLSDVTKDMLAAMADDDTELISIYYGADIDEETANKLGNEIMELYSGCDVEIYSGGQPIYYYVISVE